MPGPMHWLDLGAYWIVVVVALLSIPAELHQLGSRDPFAWTLLAMAITFWIPLLYPSRPELRRLQVLAMLIGGGLLIGGLYRNALVDRDYPAVAGGVFAIFVCWRAAVYSMWIAKRVVHEDSEPEPVPRRSYRETGGRARP